MNSVLRYALRGYAVALKGFPFGIGSAQSTVEQLRRRAVRDHLRKDPLHKRLLRQSLATVGWPVGALLESLRYSHHDWMQIYWWALRHNVPPVEYDAYDFHDGSKRADWADYLYWFDQWALPWLNGRRGANNDDVQNKLRFAQICADHSLPYAPALSSAGVTAEALPQGDLWLKAVTGNMSAGAELWLHDAEGYNGRRGHLSSTQLVAHAQHRGLLIQRRLRNHSEIEPLTNGALAALRVVTGIDRSGRVSLLGNLLILPQADYISTSGGAVAAVAWDTGIIQRSMLARDPSLAKRLEGFVVPFWKEALMLVAQAHADAFPAFVTLGWDVVLTAEGPLLLETNSGWGALAIQQFWGPLGQTPFAALVEEELAAQP